LAGAGLWKPAGDDLPPIRTANFSFCHVFDKRFESTVDIDQID
jgi:hypothetical protein